MVRRLFILAGGASKRFGAPKARAVLEGRPLAGWVAESGLAADLEPVLLVKDESLADLGWPLCVEPILTGHYPLRAMCFALACLGPGESAVFAPCDLPFVSPSTLRALADGPAPSVAWDGLQLQPLLCHLSFDQLPALQDWVDKQASARRFMAPAHRVRVAEGELRNINRPEDLVSV